MNDYKLNFWLWDLSSCSFSSITDIMSPQNSFCFVFRRATVEEILHRLRPSAVLSDQVTRVNNVYL